MFFKWYLTHFWWKQPTGPVCCHRIRLEMLLYDVVDIRFRRKSSPAAVLVATWDPCALCNSVSQWKNLEVAKDHTGPGEKKIWYTNISMFECVISSHFRQPFRSLNSWKEELMCWACGPWVLAFWSWLARDAPKSCEWIAATVTLAGTKHLSDMGSWRVYRFTYI